MLQASGQEARYPSQSDLEAYWRTPTPGEEHLREEPSRGQPSEPLSRGYSQPRETEASRLRAQGRGLAEVGAGSQGSAL